MISTDPVSLDISPQLGYKFTTRFNVGIAASYRYTFNDSIKHGWYVSPTNTAFRMFTNYDVIKGFFATAEWELAGIKSSKNDQLQKQWVNNYFVGGGKKFLIHPKVYMTLIALYNLNGSDDNPSYPRRFQIRVGFQLSELATRKKKIYYDPNR